MCLSAGWALGCWPPQTELEFSFGNAISYLASLKEGYGEEAQTQTSGFENIHLLQTSKTSFLEQPVQCPWSSKTYLHGEPQSEAPAHNDKV